MYWLLLKDGDRSALRFFYDSYVDQLYAFGMRLGSSENQVKDAIQEVFLDLWKYHSRISSVVNVKVYLYKCLANQLFKTGKEAKRSQIIHQSYMEESALSVESIETSMINLQLEDNLKVRLSEAVEDLPRRQKAVIDCLFFQDFTYEETAQILNINLRSTYTLAWKALSNLKKYLSKVNLLS
jgi:RNA polymerase sigma factor (sigma-70 family)